jgi:cyclohexanecarboxylate-CoA ligase
MAATTLEPGQAREALRARWRAAGWYQDLTVGEAIAAGARQHPDDELIFVQQGGRTTAVRLAALHERALDVAGRLSRAGVRPGEVVVLQAAVGPASTEVAALQRFLVGAAPVPPGLVTRAEAAGITAWRTYGSTEHPAVSSGGPDDPPGKRRLTDGRVAPGNEVRLVDESGDDVAPGTEGEIVARGPRQFVGYRDPALNADAYLDGTWFRTGDLARFDPDGYLVVTDRVKDVIIRGGENISAREVEEALAGAAGVREIAVCAAPDQTWGEIVCAVVVPGEEVPTLESLRKRGTSAGLARHKLPARLLVVGTLPRTAAGKVRKADLRHLLARPADGG